MESPDNKEEKYILRGRQLKFFTLWKLVKLMFIIIVSLFGVFGLLLFINVTVYPQLGFIELALNARSKTDVWKSSVEHDLGHEAVAFENMLDAYALAGGDISHVLDTLTDEFTPANWAELLEYDVDYFIKHTEISDSIKANGMLHITKLLYTSGHYDLFKQSWKMLVERFCSDRDYLNVYTELIGLRADFEYTDEEEKKVLQVLYDLELKRHLRMTASKITERLNAARFENNSLNSFVVNLKNAIGTGNVLAERSSDFRNQTEKDVVNMLSIIKSHAEQTGDENLLNSSKELTQVLINTGMSSAASLAQN